MATTTHARPHRPGAASRAAVGVALGWLLALAGCAVRPPAPAPAAPAAASQAATGAASPPAAARAMAPGSTPGQPPTWASVVSGARRVDGPLTVWQKGERYWIELQPTDFGRPLFFGPHIAQGIGESGLFGGMPIGAGQRFGGAQLVEFRRVHQQVQLVARNTRYQAPAGTPEAVAVSAAFADSLLGSTPVASLPHPDRKSVLVDANALLLTDLLGVGIRLQHLYRQPYGLDRAHSAVLAARGVPQETTFEVQAHYAAASFGLAQPNQPPALAPKLPQTLPDARSLLLRLRYGFSALPDPPMVPREADARIGHFSVPVARFADDAAAEPLQRHIYRWRLEKKDPSAALSEPVQPIVVQIDRSLPTRYRDAATRGALAWNAAFERIGFQDAVVVRPPPDSASTAVPAAGRVTVRWVTNARPFFDAIGPSQVDPRSGEILSADIALESLALQRQGAEQRRRLDLDAVSVGAGAYGDAGCAHAAWSARQLSFLPDENAAAGGGGFAAAAGDAYLQQQVTALVIHEMGHALGLRHNFRASRLYRADQLADPAFVATHGLAASVMDYLPVNLPLPGERPVPPFQTQLGPYDHWAIAYAYRVPAPGETPTQAQAALQQLAARSVEPALDYGSDLDMRQGADPDSLPFDLGDDAVEFARRRLVIVRDGLDRLAGRSSSPVDRQADVRHAMADAMREVGRVAAVLARQVGAVHQRRGPPGAGSDPLQPVPAEQQRRAVELIASAFLAPDGLPLPPALLRRLAPDFLGRDDGERPLAGDGGDEVAPSVQWLALQRRMLAHLYGDDVAQRLVDGVAQVEPGRDPYTVGELYDRVARAVWSGLDAAAGDIGPAQRGLQREHVHRLATVLLRPAAQGVGDARVRVRAQALGLLPQLERAQRRRGLSIEARAHLSDSADRLRQALQALPPRPA